MTWRNVRYDYSGATVLVTGGTSGIGAGVAEAYRDTGANVIITGTKPSLSDYDGDWHGYRYHQLDVEKREDIDRLAAAIPDLDIIVNSAGAGGSVETNEYDPDTFARIINLHLGSVYRLDAQCAPKLSKSRLRGGGSIVFISSTTAFLGYDAVPAYSSAKAGLLSLARVLAVQWASRNIRVNAIAAGLTHSRTSELAIANPGVNAATLERVPLGRHGEPVDIAGAALFLSSDSASWITGQTMTVDGGMSITGIRLLRHFGA